MFSACLKFDVYSCVLLDTVSTHCANSEHIRIDVAVIMVDAHTCACPTLVDTHAAVPLDSTSTTTGEVLSLIHLFLDLLFFFDNIKVYGRQRRSEQLRVYD